MNKIINFFKIKERNTSIKREIISGLIAFVAMCYCLPVGASIISELPGMNVQGVFALTCMVACISTILICVFTNMPLLLAGGLGINAFFVYTIATSAGFSWQQTMIVMTVSGLCYFIFSVTPIRNKLIDAIPKTLQSIISASLGAFLAFVGLNNGRIISKGSGTAIVQLNSFADPSVILAMVAIFIGIGLLFSRKEILGSLAIPISVSFAAIAGVIMSTIMIKTGFMSKTGDVWTYEILGSTIVSNLPIAPWIEGIPFGASGIEDVIFFGAFKGYSGNQFASDLGVVFSSPISYIAIFSFIFIHLFNSTATFITSANLTGIMDNEGKMMNLKRASFIDGATTLLSGPFATAPVIPLAESSINAKLGARTGLSGIATGICFLIMAFIYPIFSVFTSGVCTAPALVCIGGIIIGSAVKDIDLKDFKTAFVAFIMVLFSILTYSICDGIGIGFIAYVVIHLCSGEKKKVNGAIWTISIIYLLSLVVTALMPLFKK